MHERTTAIRPRAGVPGFLPAGESRASGRMPAALLTRIPPRLSAIAWMFLAVVAIMWIVVNVIEGQFLMEFERATDWVPPTIGILASAAIILICRHFDARADALPSIGLAYMVLISYAITFGTYWLTFYDVPPEALNSDRVGFSPVALWILTYTALVPSQPRHVWIALTLSCLALPLVMFWQVRLGLAGPFAPVDFFLVFVLPYVITGVVAYGMARLIHGLGQDVARATELGSYRLEERIGAGSMGEVWRATHALLARPAAIKVIQPAMLAGSISGAHDAVRRFEQEARITATLESPHSVAVYDFGVADDGHLFYVMELLDGIDLETLVQRYGPLEPERVVHILEQTCESLAEAHARGLVHRDIKPANIYLTQWALEEDFVKVLDFGLAKQVTTRHDARTVGVTHPDTVLGTPAYMAPEAALGREADARSDIYSLGCVAYWLVTGELVFPVDSPIEMMVAHASAVPVLRLASVRWSVPAGFEALILSCLEKDPDARPQSVTELSQRLAEMPIESPWTPARARRWWARVSDGGHAKG